MTRNIPDLLLERYLLNELPEPSMRAVRQMLGSNPSLRARLDAIDRSDAEIRSRYSPLVALHDKPASPRRFVVRSVGAALLAATALLVVFALPRTPAQMSDADRVKGDIVAHPMLAMYRRTPGGSERLADGDVVRPGDLLRLGYASAGGLYGLILSIDGRGSVTMHLPPRGDEAAPLSAGKIVLLDSAYELDDAPRIERFYLITAPHPFKVAPILAAARAAGAAPRTLPLPGGLEQATVAVQKEVRK